MCTRLHAKYVLFHVHIHLREDFTKKWEVSTKWCEVIGSAVWCTKLFPTHEMHLIQNEFSRSVPFCRCVKLYFVLCLLTQALLALRELICHFPTELRWFIFPNSSEIWIVTHLHFFLYYYCVIILCCFTWKCKRP